MSYMRGKYYIWTSGLTEKDYRVHSWVGSDLSIRNSGWAEQFNEDQIMGAALPETIFHELIVMRYAELQEERKVEQAEKRAIRKHTGNVGCDALCRRYGKPTALDRLEKAKVKTKKKDSSNIYLFAYSFNARSMTSAMVIPSLAAS